MAPGMDPAAALRAAEFLLAARRARRRVPGLPADCRPRDLEAAYAVQDAMARLAGADAGYKIGCTSARARAVIATDRPFAGRLRRAAIHASPASLALPRGLLCGVECEFALRLGRDLPAEGGACAPGDAAAAVAAVIPAIEVVESAYDDWVAAGVAQIVADNGAHGALVLGAETPLQPGMDLARFAVALSFDGREAARGLGAEALGGPIQALAWLAADRARRGEPLRAGQIVTTGTCAGFHEVRAARAAAADFGPLGTVEIRFLG